MKSLLTCISGLVLSALPAMSGTVDSTDVGTDTTATKEIMVYGASRVPTKITQAPAAINYIGAAALRKAAPHGQIAKTMEGLEGVDVVQSGANDFNINARGFNNSISRRMLVLVDGRDPSTPLINLNEWNSLSASLEDLSSIEVVRGPGSALYGQNAYNGVVNIRTSAPDEVLGSKLTIGVGEYEAYRFSLRNAGKLINNDLYYKVSIGASTQYNYSLSSRMRDTTKPLNGLEYPGIAPDLRQLSDAAKRPFQENATLRLDYILRDSATDMELGRIIAEGGYSVSGNEMYANQTGRLLVQRVEKPFGRVAYNSKRFNVQGLWQNRTTPEDLPQLVYNANARSVENSDVMSIDAQYNNTLLNDKLTWIVGAQYDYQDVNSPILAPDMTLLFPTHVIGRFYGGYAELAYAITQDLKVDGAIRVDGSTLFPTQVSPKLSFTYQVAPQHNLRLSYNRSFLRPSYTDLYRKSPAGANVISNGLQTYIDTMAARISGVDGLSNMGLRDTTARFNLGNYNLTPETANSIELGYNAFVSKNMTLNMSVYYNRRENLISSPLAGVAPDIYSRIASNSGSAQFDRIADSLLTDTLRKINGQLPAQLAMYNNAPAFVITPANIAVVNEIGMEIGTSYFFTNEFSFQGNYSYIDVKVAENNVTAQKILPNTSRHRINVGLDYMMEQSYDANITLRYVEGYEWQAGLVQGKVPSYAVVNMKAGYYITPDLRVGLNVFNLLDRAHIEIFGGTLLRRQASLSASYTF